jgi:hypothetical protein
LDWIRAEAEIGWANWMSTDRPGGPMLRMVTLVTGPKWAKTSRTTPAEGKWVGSCDVSVLLNGSRGSMYNLYRVLSAGQF